MLKMNASERGESLSGPLDGRKAKENTTDFNISQLSSIEKGVEHESPVPRITLRTICMSAVASMGEMLFGYDIGQV
jgi:hypothetical protein